MPRVIFTHAIMSNEQWANTRDKRLELLSPFATDIVEYGNADGEHRVAVGANVHDMDKLWALRNADMSATKEALGIIDPVDIFVEGG